jgi:hypothetical protein
LFSRLEFLCRPLQISLGVLFFLRALSLDRILFFDLFLFGGFYGRSIVTKPFLNLFSKSTK